MPTVVAESLVRELTPSLDEAWSDRLEELQLRESPNHFIQAAEEASSLGAFPEAVEYARRALELLSAEPTDRQARCRLHLLIGTLLWQAAASGTEFTLAQALDELSKSEELLIPADPILLRAEIRQAIGAVCYDLADRESLVRALEELDLASRELREGDHPLEAAGLLNDQAAVHVRLGDFETAATLLRRSRKVFESQPGTDFVRVELAETDHLLARLPLHAPLGHAHDRATLEEALAHAGSALELYSAVNRPRCLAHVQETSGRLLICLGALDDARDRLTKAFATQDALGDVLGMARSTAALSDLKLAENDPEGALSYLTESVRLNAAKSARQGLAWNRSALAAISARLPPRDSMRLSPMLNAVEQALADAGITV
jgi:tetratricopeptide (TPR) repeat protein